MDQNYDRDGNGDRSRRLDDLFADDPHLSVTMKARLLHQKLREQEERNSREAQGLPTEAFVSSLPVTNAAPLVDDEESGPAFAAPVQPIDLNKAAGFLRAGCPPGRLPMDVAARLMRFREERLNRWLLDLPDRHSG